ncbi:MAG: hypothetical protein KBA30_05425, partial [Clostridia bacterium]|nr:hypothetical protein [Clostridia bacterium]
MKRHIGKADPESADFLREAGPVRFLGLLLPLLPAVLSPLVLRSDWLDFLRWWATISIPALIWFPSCARLFGFRGDAGYLFAKPAAMAVTSLTVWTLSYLHIVPFTRLAILGVLAAGIAANLIPAQSRGVWRSVARSPRLLRQAAWGETLFGLVLLFASYARALKPAIESIPEKFMDYGYMMSLMRTEWLPGQDLWLAGESFNYYYFGQYLYTCLTKLAGMTPAVTYNLGMATTFALTFVLSYAVVHAWTDRMLADRKRMGESAPGAKAAPVAAGLLAGVMVQLAGNSHSFFYDESSIGNAFLRFFARIGIDVGTKTSGFFFPDSTRFIGYNPDVPDKTIHEFPFYSFLVADLHPHLINLAFVLLFLGILFVLYRSDRLRHAAQNTWTLRVRLAARDEPQWLRKELSATVRRAATWATEPGMIAAGVLLGIFTMCNFWDLVIYFAVAGLILLLANLRGYGSIAGWESIPVFTLQMLLILFPFLAASSPAVALALYAVAFAGCCLLTLLSADALTLAGAQLAFLFLLSNLVSLPFSLAFQPMSKEIALASNHSRLFQLIMLWGVHAGLGAAFFLRTLWKRRKGGQTPWPDAAGARGPLARLLLGIRPADLFACGIFLCGIGLILLPELVFVVDIYRGAYSRANTMFKFTYQAFVLLSLVAAYAAVRFWTDAAERLDRPARLVSAVLASLVLLIPLHYPLTGSTITWSMSYSPVFYAGLDGSRQIGTIDSAVIPGSEANELADDLACIEWMNENISGQPVILEMFGKSYRDNCRISVFTGLPTVLGWETHEHLWRTSKDTPDAWASVVSPRQSEILRFYAGLDEEDAAAFLSKYRIRYVVV